jgi:glycosyltransferase involved in cell wall biosynthesis
MNNLAVLTPTMPGRHLMLQKCINSIRNQTVRPYTHLIRINYDGCNAMVNSMRLAKEALSDPNIQWLAMFCDDDFYYPNHIESILSVTDNADIIYTGYRTMSPDRPSVIVNQPHDPQILRNVTNYITNPVCHRRVLEQTGFWRTDILESDWEYYRKLLDAGYRFRHTGSVSFDYVHHGDNHHMKNLEFYRP